MQFGIFAANYPLTDEDLERGTLPAALRPFVDKLFALTIAPTRLAEIRHERRAGSQYASPKQCTWEVREAALIAQQANLPVLETTNLSVEEIATRILLHSKLERR